MPNTHYPARAKRRDGELQLSETGLSFAPVARAGHNQLCFDLEGWHLEWVQVAGLERVLKRPGDVRIHYANGARFETVTMTHALEQFFADADEHIARAAANRADAGRDAA
jgi:hypothetical protein